MFEREIVLSLAIDHSLFIHSQFPKWLLVSEELSWKRLLFVEKVKHEKYCGISVLVPVQYQQLHFLLGREIVVWLSVLVLIVSLLDGFGYQVSPFWDSVEPIHDLLWIRRMNQPNVV